MSIPNRIILIEPDPARLERLRKLLAETPRLFSIQAVSNESEIEPSPDGKSPVVFISPPSQQDFEGEKSVIKDTRLSSLSHALRGTLGVILNTVFLLKLKGGQENAPLEKYFDNIEQAVMDAQEILSSYAHPAK
jgi:hypothetical protein